MDREHRQGCSYSLAVDSRQSIRISQARDAAQHRSLSQENAQFSHLESFWEHHTAVLFNFALRCEIIKMMSSGRISSYLYLWVPE